MVLSKSLCLGFTVSRCSRRAARKPGSKTTRTVRTSKRMSGIRFSNQAVQTTFSLICQRRARPALSQAWAKLNWVGLTASHLPGVVFLRPFSKLLLSHRLLHTLFQSFCCLLPPYQTASCYKLIVSPSGCSSKNLDNGRVYYRVQKPGDRNRGNRGQSGSFLILVGCSSQ